MANQEHLDRLKDNEAWNKWRAENPEIKPNLSEADLCGADLSGADLRGVDLSGANLSNAGLSWANLSKADLIKANLSNAILNRANLSKTILGAANLSKANLNEANLRRAFLYKADLIEADLRKADLGKADLRKVNLERANLKGVNFKGVNLEAANLKGVNLREINLSGAELSGVDLRGADLSYAKLNKCSISGATIYDANTYKWEIKGIICTHIFKEKKCIDYAEGEFEKAHTYIESVIEMILNAPYSFFTHFVGTTIEKAINEKYGTGALRLVGQKAISDYQTKVEFVSFQNNIDEILKVVKSIEKNTNLLLEENKAKNESKGILHLKKEVDIVPGIVADIEEVEKALVKRYIELPPLAQKFIQVIQNTIKQ
jgi:uncharacterized protein YjbI with pentapeptide repeats